jgi:hypothetical protein
LREQFGLLAHVRRILPSVDALTRICLQVVQLAEGRVPVEAQAPRRCHQGMHARRLVESKTQSLLFLLDQHGVSHRGVVAQHGQQAPAMHVPWRGDPGALQHRRRQIHAAGQLLGDRAVALGHRRVGPDEGHPHQALVMRRSF